MRDKFSELIKQGVAEFNYTPISKDVPEMDPICRMYNNIFAIPSDTHMNCLGDGRRVITGHMINTDKWCMFTQSCCWGAVDFRTSGTWSVCDFLFRNGLEGKMGNLNGDVVYFVTPMSDEDRKALMKAQVITNESNIPMPITVLTTTGDMMHIKECFDCNDIKETVRRMNESTRVIGNNWVPTETGIAGLVGNTVYVIGNTVNEAKDYWRYSINTEYHPSKKKLMIITIVDNAWDSIYTVYYDTDYGKVTEHDYYKKGQGVLDEMDYAVQGYGPRGFVWRDEFIDNCPAAYKVTMKDKFDKDNWKVEKYPNHYVETSYAGLGLIKKR